VKPVLVVAINFVREQRWPILVMLLWVLLLAFLGLTTEAARQGEDLLFVFKQVAVYVVAFSVFFGSSAIFNDRRSRRILSVLSKAIGRKQYLTGLFLGITIASAIYCFALGLTGSWTLGDAGFPIREVWFLMVCLLAACMLAGTVALMFSTFLNPFFAAGATAAAMGLPFLLSHTSGNAQWRLLIPVNALAATVLKSSFEAPATGSWFPIFLALAETFVFWFAATKIFSYMDIAVSVE
jgi:ABC-type transport system involved in multi-copper enzyme maturation permease subunit